MTQKIKISDYSTPDFIADQVDLLFELEDDHVLVTSHFKVIKKKDHNKLFLHGDDLELLGVKVDGQDFKYERTAQGLTLLLDKESAEIEIQNRIYPKKNTALEGLYQSGDILCTQNEPEGFRKITYFFDRSDILCRYKTTIIGDAKKYPYLLANGNLLLEEELENGKKKVVWEDPFKKATYLFALVAGNLAKVTDEFVTMSGRKVAIEFFVDHGNEDKCDHAIRSLQNAMKWDEEVFGLEYDLDIYMVVAVDSFNMGAMENKGLNIFNSSCVLAKPDMATDHDFYRIESVVGHEYFHNWTGNRVTLRSWFELTLKEGLTVFRDQEFSADMLDRAVQRIKDVKDLKNSQFVEDAGPMSHPIRPKEYEEINNFYTATVYNKGAEVIRMIHTILGPEAFRKGMDLYFQRHDGQAVTTEDFVQSMEDASNIDLTLFKNWYDESGTPHVFVKTEYDLEKKTFTCSFSQESKERVLHIPLRLGLVGENGEISFSHPKIENGIYHLKEKTAELVIENVLQRPVLSVNRSFSAPIYLKQNLDAKELFNLALMDSDLFNKGEAFKNLMRRNIEEIRLKEKSILSDEIVAIFDQHIKSEFSENYLAEFFDVPSEVELNQELDTPDYHGVHYARNVFMNLVGQKYQEAFKEWIAKLTDTGNFKLDAQAMGKRALKNLLMNYLAKTPDHLEFIVKFHQKASSMTEEFPSLVMLGNYDDAQVDRCHQDFIDKWEKESLVIDKWLSAQALRVKGDTLARIQKLEQHQLFDKKNPNKFRSLFGAFCHNHTHFHREDGQGYAYIADKILEADQYNPQVASRVLTSFSQVKRLPENLKEKMQGELSRIVSNAQSKDVLEIAGKYLG